MGLGDVSWYGALAVTGGIATLRVLWVRGPGENASHINVRYVFAVADLVVCCRAECPQNENLKQRLKPLTESKNQVQRQTKT